MKNENAYSIHPTATVEAGVTIGLRSHVWHYCHLRPNCHLGDDVSLGKGVFIDQDVTIGRGARIQNGVSIYRGIDIHEWVFIGPNVTFTNDRYPRAGVKNWKMSETKLMSGCSIGAGSIISCDITIGAFAMIGAGSVVTETIPAFHLAYGLPAKVMSKICACARSKLSANTRPEEYIQDCCRTNLIDDVLKVATTEIDKLK